MSTITCFSGFDESLQDKNAPSNTHCHGRRNGHKGSLQELHGRPWKRDLPAPNTKQSPQCAPVRCIKHPSAQARVANLLSLKLAEIAQQQRFFVSEWKALLKAQWNNKQKKKKKQWVTGSCTRESQKTQRPEQVSLEHRNSQAPSTAGPLGRGPSCRKQETHADMTGGFGHHSLWRQWNYQQLARQQERPLCTDSPMPAPHSGFFPRVLGVIPKGKGGWRESKGGQGGAHRPWQCLLIGHQITPGKGWGP